MKTWWPEIITGCVLGALGFLAILSLLAANGCAAPLVGPAGQAVGGAAKLAAGVNSANFLIPLSILGVAAGVTVMFLGMPKIGLPAVLGSLTALVLTLVMARFAYLFAVLGALAAVGALVAGVVWKFRALRTAFAQVVEGVQNYKANMKDVPGNRVVVNETLASVQTPATQALVQQVKETL